LKKNKIPVPDFAPVTSEEQLNEICEKFGLPAVLKACEDSYDGRGNFLIRSMNQVHEAYSLFSGRERMLEKFVPFTKEISIMVARNPGGQIESFPVAENLHRDGILDTTIVPARIGSRVELKAKKLAEKAMSKLQGAGIFGIEMFVTKGGHVLLNEIAPRPHNSGHYANEACSVSQFEQHLRAILDLPLSKPELVSPAAMVNILGPEGFSGSYSVKGLNNLFKVPGIKLYLYGKKSTKPRRKLGHITATGKTTDQALQRASKARKMIAVIPGSSGNK
jgi:5-(carboxyamino)imidazole ribonucleotide synthase